MGWLAEEPVGCISVMKYGPAFAFLGLYIVLPAYRGQGHGQAIWDAGVASAGARTIGLDGVPAQQANYRKSGFALAYESARWTGSLDRPLPLDARVRLLDRDDLPFAADFDSRHVAAPREHFLDAWLASTPARQSMGYFDGAALRGYGTIRRCRSGWKVGPLFAETPAIAEALLASLLNRAGGEPVSIDIPRPNTAAAELAKRLGFAPAFDTARITRARLRPCRSTASTVPPRSNWAERHQTV